MAALALWTIWTVIPKPWRDLDPDAAPRPVAARGDLAEIERTTIEIFRTASPSVVHITTLVTAAGPFSLDVQQIPQGTGSGFVWDKDGHIVTNHHVISGASGGGDRPGGRVELARPPGRVVSGQGSRSAARSTPRRDLLHPITVGSSADLRGRPDGARDRQPVRPGPDADDRRALALGPLDPQRDGSDDQKT